MARILNIIESKNHQEVESENYEKSLGVQTEEREMCQEFTTGIKKTSLNCNEPIQDVLLVLRVWCYPIDIDCCC